MNIFVSPSAEVEADAEASADAYADDEAGSDDEQPVTNEAAKTHAVNIASNFFIIIPPFMILLYHISLIQHYHFITFTYIMSISGAYL